jgi:hypothetical protein
MKRCVFKISMLLLVGAIMNVAVAWGFAIWTPIVSRPSARQLNLIQRSTLDENHMWQRWAPSTFASRPILSSSIDACGLTASNVTADRTDGYVTITTDDNGNLERLFIRASPPRYVFDFGLLVSAGWPMRSLRGARFIAGDGQLDQHNLAAIVEIAPAAGSATLVHAIPVEERIWVPREHRILPTGVIPIGFVINSVFYAALLLLLFAIPGALRRRFRIKRGQCAACGYDLRSNALQSEKCPECGAVAAEVQ